MTRAVRRTKAEMEFDARDAVRDAAERAGLSVSEWVERVVLDYADQLGLSTADIDEDLRREALAQRVDKLARRPASRRSDLDLSDLTRAGPKRRRTRSNIDEDDYVLQRVERPARAAVPTAPDRSLHAIEDQIARMSERMDRMLVGQPPHERDDVARLEDKLNQLIYSLDVQRKAAAEPVRQKPAALRSIEEAVAEITRRQRNLSPDATYQDIQQAPTPWSLQKEISSLATQIEETRRTFSQNGIAESVEGRIDVLSRRIDEVMGEISGKLNQPNHDLAMLEALQTQIGKLSERVEQSDLSADGLTALQRTMGDLFSYVEDMRAAALEQAKRSEAQTQDLQVLHSLEKHLVALSDRVTRDEVSREGLASIEATLSELFQHVEDTRIAALDAASKANGFEDLQHQIGELSHRISKTETNFTAIASIEQGMSALFNAFQKSQSAMAEVADKAVKHALEQSQTIVAPELKREVDDLRQAQSQSEQRTHTSLTAMHETLEKVVDRLATLDETAPFAAVAASYAPASYASGPAPMFAPAEPFEPAIAEPMRAQMVAPPVLLDESRVDEHMHHDTHLRSDEILIEPGSGFTPGHHARDEMAAPQVLAAAPSSQSNFIAAARLAAQKGGQAGSEPLGYPHASTEPAAEKKSISKLRQLVSGRKLLIAATGIAVLIGAEQSLQPNTNRNSALLAPIVQSPQMAATPQPKSRASLTQAEPAQRLATRDPVSDPKSNFTLDAPAYASVAKVGVAVPSSTTEKASITTEEPATENVAEQAARVPLGLLREAAQSGNSAAQYELGNRLLEGRGVARDLFNGAMWLEKAAYHNLPPAQYRMGTLYEKGTGVTRDLKKARDWYQRAADLGHVRAMHNLAVMLSEGIDGKPDYSTAAIWFRRAAEYGVRDSQYNLAILYARGLGIELSLPQSYAWFSLAAKQGDDDAARKREDVAARLDAKQTSTAKTLVETYRQRRVDPAANDVVPTGGWEALQFDQKSKPKMTRLVN